MPKSNMFKTALVAAGLAAALSLGAAANQAIAMPNVTPTQLGLATSDTGVVLKTAMVCGRWGCRRILPRAGVWLGPRRPLYDFAGPAWGWSRPAWGWSTWGRPGWGWNRW
jgi:hypothetical protein